MSQPSLQSFGVEQIRQYPGQEQVELKVEIEIPGSWFGGTDSGSLSAAERRQKFTAQAVEFAPVREFAGAGGARAKKTKEPAIRFLCIDDAADDAQSCGYWIQLSRWNRYRNDTYKDRRQDELPFIMGAGKRAAQHLDAGAASQVASATAVPAVVGIKNHFTLQGEDTHKQKDGQVKPCKWWVCTQPGCKTKDPIKELGAGTGQLFRHLKRCNNALWRELSLESKHSKVRLNADGHEVQVRSPS
jgi:hypothetical protein